MTPILTAHDLNAFLEAEIHNLAASIRVLELQDDWLLARMSVSGVALAPRGHNFRPCAIHFGRCGDVFGDISAYWHRAFGGDDQCFN